MEESDNFDTQFVTVSTEQAVYLQHPGRHTETSVINTETVEKVDAVVLEDGTEPFDDVSIEWLQDQPQYQVLVDQCIESETPIFVVDVPYNGSDTRLYLSEVAKLGLPCAAGLIGVMHGYTAMGLLALPAFAFSLGGANRSPRVNRVVGQMQLMNAYTWTGFRSAVAAEKLESIVAPQLAEETGVPPVILIEYGAGHLDIGSYLQYPRLRQQVIRMHQRLGRSVPDELLDEVAVFQFDAEEPEKHITTAAL